MTASLVPVVPNSRLEEIEKAKQETERQEAAKLQAVNTRLSAHINTCFEGAKRVRQTVETTILNSRKQVKGQYKASILAEIQKFGGSQTFIQHTGNKCTAAQSWIQDIVLPPDEFPAMIEPTPIPDLPEEEAKAIIDAVTAHFQEVRSAGMPVDPRDVTQMALQLREDQLSLLRTVAERKAKGMQAKIFDQLTEANFGDALIDVVANMIQTPLGILKGPIVRRRRKLAWVFDPQQGRSVPEITEKLGYELASVDPIDFYPGPNNRTVDDGYTIERVRTPRKDLRAMLGVEGYRDDEILAALKDYGRSGLQTQQTPDSERATIENRDTVTTLGGGAEDPTIEGLEYWGSVPGSMLRDWGMEIADDEQENEFDVCAEVYGTHVVRAVLNPDPLGRKPYYTCCFQEEAGSVWGKGLPEIIADIQDILNGCVRHIQNNLAICCLTGDTVVYRHDGSTVTIDELWALKRCGNLREDGVRSLNEKAGVFFGNAIVDVYDNGVAPVFEVHTSRGYRIKATASHRFMDIADKYRELSTFSPGNRIAVHVHGRVDYDTITSITPRGEERVFDLQMTAPNHNFVANGFVSHNSGPQVGLDLSKMTSGFDWQNMHPWKVWPFTSSMGTTPPITFFQPQSHVGELIAVFEKFDSISDDLTVPKYSYGNQQVVGAAATASGLSMLMNAANKRIKRVVAGMDRRVIRPLLERFYVFNMLYDEDESIKGDVQIVPRGAMALIVKEQTQMKRQEFMNATANPVDLQIIGIRGRARLLREVAQSLSIPVDKVVPSDEELEAQMKAAADQAAAATAGAVPSQPGAGVENAPVAGGAPAAEAMPGSAQAIPQ